MSGTSQQFVKFCYVDVYGSLFRFSLQLLDAFSLRAPCNEACFAAAAAASKATAARLAEAAAKGLLVVVVVVVVIAVAIVDAEAAGAASIVHAGEVRRLCIWTPSSD
jgi:hypothetical protein